MAITKGIFVFRGDLGSPMSHYAKTSVMSVLTDLAAETLGTFLDSQSEANLAKRAFQTITGLTDTAPGIAANVDRKAIIYFRQPTNLKVRSITIPAPVSTICEETPEGERITSVAMTAIVAAIATATGIPYTPLYGVVLQKR